MEIRQVLLLKDLHHLIKVRMKHLSLKISDSLNLGNSSNENLFDSTNNMDDDYDVSANDMNCTSPFFGFPFQWVWNNQINISRFQANVYCSSSQIHVIQDFNVNTESENVSANMPQILEIESYFVCVYLCTIKYDDNSKLVMGICSGCDTNGDLIK